MMGFSNVAVVIEFRSFTLDGASGLGPIEEASPAKATDAVVPHMPFGECMRPTLLVQPRFRTGASCDLFLL
jgi:hypothetical protein